MTTVIDLLTVASNVSTTDTMVVLMWVCWSMVKAEAMSRFWTMTVSLAPSSWLVFMLIFMMVLLMLLMIVCASLWIWMDANNFPFCSLFLCYFGNLEWCAISELSTVSERYIRHLQCDKLRFSSKDLNSNIFDSNWIIKRETMAASHQLHSHLQVFIYGRQLVGVNAHCCGVYLSFIHCCLSKYLIFSWFMLQTQNKRTDNEDPNIWLGDVRVWSSNK